MQRPFRIAIVAGEISGDILGAGIINQLKRQLPHAEFIGIGGVQMIAEGLQSLVDIQRLSVMGISDVLRRYPELFRIRQKLLNAWIQNPPDVFIGIDYPDFNLSLAYRLKRHGIKTIQVVSPKIWAWRQKRVFYIKKSVDLVLTLFPFEANFYHQYGVPAQFIGHPLADLLDLQNNTMPIKLQYGYTPIDKVIAVLPGSRMGELKYMGPLFIEVMKEISLQAPNIHFIIPMVNEHLREQFLSQLHAKEYALNIKIIDRNARDAMALSDVVLTKSGTATLEAMLLKRPMVVAYKWGALTHAIIAPRIKVPFISLPNLLANRDLVPEFVQSNAKALPIAQALLQYLQNPNDNQNMHHFTTIHNNLRQNANETAALAIIKMLD